MITTRLRRLLGTVLEADRQERIDNYRRARGDPEDHERADRREDAGGGAVSEDEYWTRQGLLRELWRKTEGGYGYTKVGEYYRRPRSSRYFALRVRANNKHELNEFDDWRRACAWVAERC